MQPILHSFAYSLDYLRDQIAEVTDGQLTAQPDGVPNHPAWTIGHLVFIAQEIGGVIGIEPWLGEKWARQFGPGSQPSLPGEMVFSRGALLVALETAQGKLTTAVAGLTDSELDTRFPDPAYADVFPTIRHALTQSPTRPHRLPHRSDRRLATRDGPAADGSVVRIATWCFIP
jgi:hypothetical protein